MSGVKCRITALVHGQHQLPQKPVLFCCNKISLTEIANFHCRFSLDRIFVTSRLASFKRSSEDLGVRHILPNYQEKLDASPTFVVEWL